MMIGRISRLLVPFLFFSFLIMYKATPGAAASAASKSRRPSSRQAQPAISYTVGMSRPWTHLLEVEMRIRWDNMPDQIELKMPVWTPGSYLVREYARHVQDLSASGPGGRTVAWRKINKNTWQADTKGLRELIISYRVYSNELTVRTNELNDEHAFWNNSALLLFPRGQLGVPSTVRVVPHGNWRVATGLRKVAGAANTFRAANYDELYDSPFEVSDFKEKAFSVAGKPHRFVVTGEGNYDLEQIAADTAKIAEEAVKVFGELPIDDYLFILNLRGRGGLEHLNSTALQWGRWNFTPGPQYTGFLNLVAHEYFHLWNVKRIRPDALGPFDYENENYTKLLWVAEGTTAYYEGRLLQRAGLISDREMLETKARLIHQLQSRPGRFQTSLEEASLDAWIKYYRQDENAVNNQISYYDKGEIVNMMLDITIIASSGGKRSLDDVMRYLYTEFYKKGRNYSPSDLQTACERMAGASLEKFFADNVRGREEIDFDSILRNIGLRLERAGSDAEKAYLGADLAEAEGRLMVRSIPSGTPAHEQGLNYNDQILAVDGHRASLSFLESYLSRKAPGDIIKLTVFRFDKLRELSVKLGKDPRPELFIRPLDEPTDEQKRLYKIYFGRDLVNGE